MTVLYEQKRDAAPGAAPPAGPMGSDDSSIKKIDCKGPVTIVSKTQVATGNDATFDRIANKIFLIGNAALSDGPNVTARRARRLRSQHRRRQRGDEARRARAGPVRARQQRPDHAAARRRRQARSPEASDELSAAPCARVLSIALF